MRPSEEEIIAYGKKRTIELFGIEEKWAERLARKLWSVTLSTGGGISELKDLESGIRVVIKSWIEHGDMKEEGA